MDNLMFADGLVSENELEHYGVPRKSGRYPWGSGENPYHHGQAGPGGRRREREAEREAKRYARDERKKKKREVKAINRENRETNRAVKADRKKAYRNRRVLSQEELERRIARLEKEKKLRDLTNEDLRPAKKATDEALQNVGKKVLVGAGAAVGLTVAEVLIRNAMGDKVSPAEIPNLTARNFKPKK